MLLFTFSLYGCNVEMSQKVNETLYQAENCMEEFPDSALSLLQHISHPEDLKGKAQADYALLYSQACDKNQISITNDSLIRIAVRYYEDKDEDFNAAKSYFYQGCVYRNANQDAMAIEAYLKALDKMPKGKPHKLWMQIYFNLGERYRYQNLYGSSMEMFQKCLGASKELKDSSLLFFPYRGIANAYLFTEKSDSALIYYQKALAISQYIHNDFWESAILDDISNTYLYKGDTLKAEQFIRASIEKDKSASSLYIRSKFLCYRNELDSAKELLLVGCQSNSLYIKTNCYNLLYEIEKKLQNHFYAYAYNDSFNLYRDSIEILKRHQEIQNLHIKHAIELQKGEEKRKEENIYWIICFIFMMLLSGSLCLYLYLKKKYKEYLLRKRILTLNDQNQTISNYLEQKLGKEILLQETITAFKREKLQRGIDTFNVSPWKEKLNEAEKQIKSGDYIRPDEQRLLYQELDVSFKEFIAGITEIYPKMSREDVYYCILSSQNYKSRTIMYCMSSSGGALRTRKNRLKKNMAEDTFQMIFRK